MPKVIDAKSWQLTPSADGRRYSKYPDGDAPGDPEPPGGGVDYEFPTGSTPSASAATLTAIPTFHNISLEWPEASGSSSNECLVRYKPTGGNWRQALSLWYDGRSSRGNVGYRGSIVKVSAGTTYDVEVLTANNRVLASTQVTTWSETFPVGTTVGLPASTTSQYNITTSGTAGAYRLYEPSGASATIDVSKSECCIYVDASYVIIRGLTLTGAGKRSGGGLGGAIQLSPNAHHVVIEDCDISDFGTEDTATTNPRIPTEGFGCNWMGGIVTDQFEGSDGQRNKGITHIVIQNNRIHSPTFDTNAWGDADTAEKRVQNGTCQPSSDQNHPAGPHGIIMYAPGGQIVIRYNEITANIDRMFNDGIGGGANFGSGGGNLGSDSDVYGNVISHCWDDGLEIEGTNKNVRIYENHISKCYMAIATGEIYIGPVYAFRNVATEGVHTHSMLTNRGAFLKLRGTSDPSLMSRLYLFHNTAYSATTSDRIRDFLNWWTVAGSRLGVYSRNNIWRTNSAPASGSFPMTDSDYDYELTPHSAWSAEAPNAVIDTPVYDGAHASGTYTLADASPGRNAGVYLPNFNEGYLETGPDMGAQERGATALQFGVRA